MLTPAREAQPSSALHSAALVKNIKDIGFMAILAIDMLHHAVSYWGLLIHSQIKTNP